MAKRTRCGRVAGPGSDPASVAAQVAGAPAPGVGKTHLAVALALCACQNGASVYFTTCALLEVSRSALRLSRMPARDAELARELTQIAAAHPRYGHRFAWGILTPQRHWCVN